MTARKPTTIKILEGNRGKRSLPKDEPRPTLPVDGSAPKWLDAIARKEWNRLHDELAGQALVTNWDAATFAAYCESYSGFQKAIKMLKKEGEVKTIEASGYQFPNPWVKLKREAALAMVKYGGLLGLNPSARNGLSVSKARKLEKTDAEVDFGL